MAATRPKPPSAVDDCNAIYNRIREIAKEENKMPTIDVITGRILISDMKITF